MSLETELVPPSSLEIGKIHCGDCIDLMRQIAAGSIDLVFADPPFNIGYSYDAYHDRQSDEDYINWSRQWMEEVHRVLKPGGTFWLAIGDEYAAELKVDAEHKIGFTTRSWVVWYYTFGVNCTRKFSRSHAHLFHFIKDEGDFTFNAEDPVVRVPSARALVYGDKRANPAGRLPDDTWIVRPAADDNWVLRPQDLPDGFQPPEDTWYYARVAGTFKERQGFHGCQMPEQLLGRIIRVSSNPSDIVLDPFAGSGTTLAVAKKLGRRWIGCEVSADYVGAATERLSAIRSDDPLDGPADPIASAPSTANGRRLPGFAAAAVQEERSVQPPDAREPIAGLSVEEPAPSDAVLTDPSPSAAAPSVVAPTAVEQPASEEAVIAPAVVMQSVTALPATAPPAATPPASPQAARSPRRELRKLVRDAIVSSFYAAHDGYSIDWLLCDPALQAAYHEACRAAGLIGGPADWNRELLRLRKTGGFPKRGEIKKVFVEDQEFDSYDFAAEIAWRLTSDKFGGPSLDEILCDPEKAAYFDRTAKKYATRFTPLQLRWAALRLRKASRDLVAEMKQYHFVFDKRDFTRFQSLRRCKPTKLAGEPGSYLLCDERKRPLFVGRSYDLGRRLAQHLESRAILEAATHVSILSGSDLPGEDYRAAFKEDLVRRHQPRWNMNLVGLMGGTAR